MFDKLSSSLLSARKSVKLIGISDGASGTYANSGYHSIQIQINYAEKPQIPHLFALHLKVVLETLLS